MAESTPKRSRATMPDGVTPEAISQILFDCLTEKQISNARDAKTALFEYKVDGRKGDRDNMYKVHVVLGGLLKAFETHVIDTTVLTDAFVLFNSKSGGVMSGSSSPPENQAYALKCMLGEIGRTKRSSVTGMRLAPWLRDLCDMMTSMPAEDSPSKVSLHQAALASLASENGPSAAACTAIVPMVHIDPKAPVGHIEPKADPANPHTSGVRAKCTARHFE